MAKTSPTGMTTKQVSDDIIIQNGPNWAQFKRDGKGKPYCLSTGGDWTPRQLTEAQILWAANTTA